MRFLALAVLPLLLLPGKDKLPLTPRQVLGPDSPVRAVPIPLVADDPADTKVGKLRYLKGWRLENDDPAFGSFSAMLADRDELVLLNDAGGFVRLALDAKGDPGAAHFGNLPDGPGGGLIKRNRDSESMTRARANGPIWVGFENRNAIWRYSADLARGERGRMPPEMRKWPTNGGAEAMVALRSGKFLVFSERGKGPPGANAALLYDRDPVDEKAKATRFYYRAPSGYRVTDAVEMPDGRLMLLHRRVSLWPLFSAKLAIADPRKIEEEGILTGDEIATLVPPVAVDNMEALAVTRDGGRTIVWIASDDNFGLLIQRSLLLKFALED